MSKVLFVDTDAFIAYFSLKDPLHKKARSIVDVTEKVVITDYVYDEILTLSRKRLGIEPSISIMRYMKDNKDVEIITVTEKDKIKANEIFGKYKDKDFSYTDCTSFAVIERLKLKHILTFDRHFPQYGITPLP